MQLTEHVHALKIPFRVAVKPGVPVERFVYVYLVYSDAIYLVDSGVAGSEAIILDDIRKSGREPGEIAMIFQTHSHPDHIGGTRAIREVSGCRVAAHAAERSWIEDVHLQAEERPVPGFHSLVGGSVPVDRILEDGEFVEIGDDLTLAVLHTPGHSRGSVSFVLREEGVIFSGDAIPLAGDLPIYEDLSASVRSIRKLKHIQGADLLLAAWDEPRRGGAVQERMDAGLRWMKRIQDSVNRAVDTTGMTDPIAITERVLVDLGISAAAVNPLVARSIQAHMHAYNREDPVWE